MGSPLAAASAVPRGNIVPILNEIAHALDRLISDGESTVIDLARLPFSPGELESLETTLGEGELVAKLDALGESRIRETVFPGVWWIEHRNAGDDVVGRYIEITRSPDILRSQTPDIEAGQRVLAERLTTMQAADDNVTAEEERE